MIHALVQRLREWWQHVAGGRTSWDKYVVKARRRWRASRDMPRSADGIGACPLFFPFFFYWGDVQRVVHLRVAHLGRLVASLTIWPRSSFCSASSTARALSALSAVRTLAASSLRADASIATAAMILFSPPARAPTTALAEFAAAAASTLAACLATAATPARFALALASSLSIALEVASRSATRRLNLSVCFSNSFFTLPSNLPAGLTGGVGTATRASEALPSAATFSACTASRSAVAAVPENCLVTSALAATPSPSTALTMAPACTLAILTSETNEFALKVAEVANSPAAALARAALNRASDELASFASRSCLAFTFASRAFASAFPARGFGGGGGGGGGSSDLFDMLSGRGRQQRQPQGMRKGQNVVHQLTVSLEEIYMGKTRKLRMRREVIESGSMSTCTECGGKGVNIRVVRMGPMIQQVQEGCRACDGQGSQYQSKQVQEVMEVVVPKGAPDGYKLTFHEKADEIAAGIPGDVIFVLQESAHPEFKRKGADLYVKRSISLVEALCGFRMELTHLDGRKLLIKTGPGQVIAPVNYDPFKGEEAVEWETHQGMDCPDLETIAKADTDDVEKLKQVISKGQLRGKGVGAFRLSGGKASFYRATAEEVHTSMKPSKGTTLYTLADPAKSAAQRMMFAVKDEGMPVFKSPMEQGNLFLILDIVFPDHLDAAAMASLKAALPPALHASSVGDDDENYDVVELVKLDPVHSFKATAVDSSNDATQEDEREAAGGGVQCAQQ
mmetsp:Transcript_9268/g.22319  ORF Transcript_9268/g.22319 Transcript_9268/m.22319 type:complete len:739 (+) Transcript_9268:207-2423(+)